MNETPKDVLFTAPRKRHAATDDAPGAVLLVVVLIAAALLLFAGIAIDSAIVAGSKAQQRHAAESVAAASLQAFSAAGGDSWAKLTVAIDRADQILGSNYMLADPYLKIPDEEKELGTNQSTSPAASHGRIVPGVWYFRPEPGACGGPTPCPCDTASAWATPCFRPLDFSDAGDLVTTPNAFHVLLSTSESSPVRTLFAKLAGHEFVAISSSATVAVIPRHGVFLADLSRSSHRETHIPVETTEQYSPGDPRLTGYSWMQSSEYAFKIGNLPCPADHSNPCLPETPFMYPYPVVPSICTIEGGLLPDLYDVIYNFYEIPNGPIIRWERSGQETPPTKHFKDDYACYSATYTDDTTPPVSKTVHYLVDTFTGATDTGETYEGPEPLSSILDAVHYGVNLFRSRAVPGDLVGLLGFDKSAKIAQRRFDLISSGTTDFQEMLDVTDVTGQDAGKLATRLSDHLLFTRVEGGANFAEAVDRALSMLTAAPGAAEADNFVVMFSDGIANCTTDQSTGDRTCGLDFSSYQASVQAAMQVVETTYVQNNVRLHMVLLGDHVTPHTLLRVSKRETATEKSCMDDEEARLENPPLDFVDYSSYDVGNAEQAFQDLILPAGASFPDPNRWYMAVRKTGGLWLPVRPCCASLAGVCTDVRPDLTLRCKCDGCDEATKQAETPGDVVTLPPYTDDYGRIVCDPKGRTRREQFHDAIDEILQESPFVVVE